MGDFKSTLIREQPWKAPSWIGLKKHWVTAVEKIIVSVIYCSPRQSNDKFDWFISNFEQLLGETNKSKPPLFVISDDFNAKCFLWWSNDINSTEGSKLFSVTSFNGFCQFINELTHVQTSSSLIFLINQIYNLILDSMHLYTQFTITNLYTLVLTTIFPMSD